MCVSEKVNMHKGYKIELKKKIITTLAADSPIEPGVSKRHPARSRATEGHCHHPHPLQTPGTKDFSGPRR